MITAALLIPRQSIVEVSANYSPRTLLGVGFLLDNEGSRVNSAARAALPNSGEVLLLLSKLPDRANLRMRRQIIDLSPSQT